MYTSSYDVFTFTSDAVYINVVVVLDLQVRGEGNIS